VQLCLAKQEKWLPVQRTALHQNTGRLTECKTFLSFLASILAGRDTKMDFGSEAINKRI
jgi:hypothetical protein